MQRILVVTGVAVALGLAPLAYAQTPEGLQDKRRVITPNLFNPLTPAPENGHDDSGTFAAQLSEVIRIVEDQYAQPIARKVLVAAAIRGLYEAAGREIPPTLDAEVQKSVDDPIQLQRLIREAREKLGNPERLRGSGAIHAALKALTKSLDPYSDVVVGEQTRTVNAIDPKAPRFGFEFAEARADGALIIKAVSLGSPA